MQVIIRLVLAVLASLASVGLSWPFWRDYQYWAESATMWNVYIGAGFLLAVGVFYLFFEALATLFEHDELERSAKSRLTDK